MPDKLLSVKQISQWTYLLVLGAWLSLCLGVFITMLVLDFRDVKKELIQYGQSYSDHLDKEMLSSEIVLKGFSALFSAVGDSEPEKVARYVRSVIATNDQIFSLEVAKKVSRTDREAFTSEMRRKGFPGFTIKSFSYDSGRKWESAQDKPFYYPIVFMEPSPAASKEILGLDMESVPFLQQAMMQSFQRNAPVATYPFRLVQGNLAYVVFCPIPSQQSLVVDMVIDAAKFAEPVKFPTSDGWSVAVHHRAFKQDDRKGQLFASSGNARSALETALLPTYAYQKYLATNDEPFVFIAKRQTGWSDLSVISLGLMLGLTIMSSLMLVGYLRGLQRNQLQHLEYQKHMWKLANHDALTGIPNRMLLMDRLGQAIAASERSHQYGALVFLDMDNFKSLNDTQGHTAGDLLLIEVARRIQDCIREIDTVARFGGDEFVVILSELGLASTEAATAAELVVEKIRTVLAQPYQLPEQEYRTTASMGVRLFKGNQQSAGDLIKLADTAMYQAKTAKQQSEFPKN